VTSTDMKQAILNRLSPGYPWKDRFRFFPETGSTNDDLKALAKQGAPHGTILIADRQTGGHGRMGRSFLSPEGVGIYMSVLLRPDCAPTELMHLTCAAAVAMCDAVAEVAGKRPGIKWTNDLVMEKRKIAGILTELSVNPKTGLVDHAIVGIGINCCQAVNDFAPEIQSFAGSLSMVTGREIDRSCLAAAMIQALYNMWDSLFLPRSVVMNQYRADCVTVGHDVSLVRGDEIRHGHAIGINDQGALIVRFPDGTAEAVNSGEVSIRGMYGYV